MRIALLIATAGLSCLSGCALLGDKAHIGCEFRIFKPGYVDQDTAMIVNQQPGVTQGQAMGTSIGPLGGGDFWHQGQMQTLPMPIAPAVPHQRIYAPPPPAADPCNPDGPQLTQAQFRQIQRMLQQRDDGIVPERLPTPKRAAPCPEK